MISIQEVLRDNLLSKGYKPEAKFRFLICNQCAPCELKYDVENCMVKIEPTMPYQCSICFKTITCKDPLSFYRDTVCVPLRNISKELKCMDVLFEPDFSNQLLSLLMLDNIPDNILYSIAKKIEPEFPWELV